MPHWRRNLWVVALANFITMVGMSAFIPFFPDVLRELGMTGDREVKIWSGLLVAVAPLAACVMGPIWGALGDRYGRKLMMVRSLAAIAVFVGLMGLVTSPWAISRLGLSGWWLTPWPLLILRFGQGVFSGFIAPALTLVTVGAPEDRQNRVTAISQSAVVAGTVVGPALGGQAAEGGGPHLAFLLCAGLAALATGLVAALASEMRRDDLPPSERMPPWHTLRRAWADTHGTLAAGGLLPLMIGLFLVQMASTLVYPVMRLHVEHFRGIPEERLPSTAAYAFTALALGQILCAPLWARWSDRVGTGRLLPFTALLTALVHVPMGFLRSAPAFWGLRFLQGAVAAGTVPAAYAHVGRLSTHAQRGGAYGLALSSFQLANVVGPVAGGYLAAAVGTTPLFLVSAGLLAGASAWMRRKL